MVSKSHKRLRIFAGPNGSGKSTITKVVLDHVHLGVYVNADELKVILQRKGRLDFSAYRVNLDHEWFIAKFRKSSLASKIDDVEMTLSCISFDGNQIILKEGYEVEDYFVSYITSYIWEELLKTSNKFTVETVMSHPSKLDFMRQAQEAGFKVYLYFVSLADPELNKRRVQTRVSQGGHLVDENKIKQRYYRTMNYLYEALKITDEAYLFDNSAGEPNLFATKKHGIISVKSEYIPKWFATYVLNMVERLKSDAIRPN